MSVARDLPLFDALPAEGDPPAPAPSVEEEAASPAWAAAAVDPAFADDPGEVTLRGEHDPEADPRLLAAERCVGDYRQARDRGNHETAGGCIVRLARILAPGCPDFAWALHMAEAALALCRVNLRRGLAGLRELVARRVPRDPRHDRKETAP